MVIKRRCPWPPLRGAVALGMLAATTACTAPIGGGPTIPQLPSIVDPVSPDALMLSNLTWLLHAIMGAVFLIVFTALIYIYRRYRSDADGAQGRRIYGHVPLEIAWTAAPALVLLAVYVFSMFIMNARGAEAGDAGLAGGAPVRVVAIGRQWWWEYQLPDYGAVTANELHLPAGQPVLLELHADDVLHNWWVPQLAGKRYMIPGRVNELTFTPTQSGVYGGACGEFCGIQHAWMRIRVVVEPPEVFRAWAEQQARPAPAPASELARVGEQVFIQANCVSCHAVRGRVAPTANAGPDLTHMASRAIIAAGVLENTPENMARWLRAPQEVKPGNHMPSLRLTEEQVAALTAYMFELR